MSRRQVILILIVLFLGLGAWYRWVEMRRPAPPAEDAPRVFLAIEPNRVAALTSIFAGDTTRIERRDGRWRVVSPVDYPADPVAVEAVLSRCRRLAVIRAFAPDPGSRGRYSLVDSGNELRLGLDDGGEVRLSIGAPAAAAGAFYVQVSGRDSIGLYPEQEVYNFFRRTTSQWRDPTLLVFSADRAVRVDLESAGDRVRLERPAPGRPWRVTAPFPGVADQPVVEEFVKGLRAMKAVSFPDDRPAGLAGYGLESPAGSIEVADLAGVIQRLEIGSVPADSRGRQRFARVPGRPGIYGVPSVYFDLSRRSDLFFRARRLFAIPRSLWTGVTLRAGDRRIELRPDSTGAWRVEGEGSTPGAPPADRTDLVDLWAGLVAESLMAAPAAGPPREFLRLEIATASGAREEVAVDSPLATPVGELWPAWPLLRDPPRPGEVFLLSGDPVRRSLALLERR